jgi:hypothetical protein
MLMDVAAVAKDKSVDVEILRMVGGMAAEECSSRGGRPSSDIETSSSSDGSKESGELGSDGDFSSGIKSSSSSVGGKERDELGCSSGGLSSDIKSSSLSDGGGGSDELRSGACKSRSDRTM